MKLVVVILAVSTLGLSAQVGSQNIIKQRAKDLRDQNNARQGVAPPAPAPQPQPAVRTPVAPPSPGQQSLTRFQSGLAAIKAGTAPTAAQQQKLVSDLFGMAQGGGKPAYTTAEKLVKDMSAAFTEKPLSAASRARLVQDLDGLLNPQKYPHAKIPAIVEDIRSVFQSNGLDAKRAGAIADSAKALSNEVQGNTR